MRELDLDLLRPFVPVKNKKHNMKCGTAQSNKSRDKEFALLLEAVPMKGILTLRVVRVLAAMAKTRPLPWLSGARCLTV